MITPVLKHAIFSRLRLSVDLYYQMIAYLADTWLPLALGSRYGGRVKSSSYFSFVCPFDGMFYRSLFCFNYQICLQSSLIPAFRIEMYCNLIVCIEISLLVAVPQILTFKVVP
jgi:hypothetical protein